jgi:hypothetical protein
MVSEMANRPLHEGEECSARHVGGERRAQLGDQCDVRAAAARCVCAARAGHQHRLAQVSAVVCASFASLCVFVCRSLPYLLTGSHCMVISGLSSWPVVFCRPPRVPMEYLPTIVSIVLDNATSLLTAPNEPLISADMSIGVVFAGLTRFSSYLVSLCFFKCVICFLFSDSIIGTTCFRYHHCKIKATKTRYGPYEKINYLCFLC